MSLQELDPKTKSVNAASDADPGTLEQELQVASGTKKTTWLEKHYPQFFKPAIVANRSKNLTGESLPAKKNWQSVGRKLDAGKTTNIALHFDQKSKSFYFRCLDDDVRLVIDAVALQNATAVVKGSEWVRMKAGAKVLCLNRSSLRSAFNKLKP